MEITALVFGILSVALPGLGLLFAIPALVMGIMAIVRKRRKGFGIAATVMGGIALPFQLGILAAISIPAFINYTKRAKTAEATTNVRALSEALVTAREERGEFPPSTKWTPAEPCCDEGCAAPSRLEEFQAPPWTSLGFSSGASPRYQYRWIVGDGGVRVEAKGDLDCDGIESLFSRNVILSTYGDTQVGELQVENELE